MEEWWHKRVAGTKRSLWSTKGVRRRLGDQPTEGKRHQPNRHLALLQGGSQDVRMDEAPRTG